MRSSIGPCRALENACEEAVELFIVCLNLPGPFLGPRPCGTGRLPKMNDSMQFDIRSVKDIAFFWLWVSQIVRQASAAVELETFNNCRLQCGNQQPLPLPWPRKPATPVNRSQMPGGLAIPNSKHTLSFLHEECVAAGGPHLDQISQISLYRPVHRPDTPRRSPG